MGVEGFGGLDSKQGLSELTLTIGLIRHRELDINHLVPIALLECSAGANDRHKNMLHKPHLLMVGQAVCERNIAPLLQAELRRNCFTSLPHKTCET